MDRERLKEVHQSDLTEGRINQDFVDWLQTKGMSYLTVLLVFICAYSAWIYYKRNQSNYQADAWAELNKASLPSSLQDVADKYGDVGAISELARLRAANELLIAVQNGKMLGAEGETPKALTDKDRTDYLERADSLFRKIVESDDKSSARTLLVVVGFNGQAAVAESLGKLDQAAEFYNKAAQRAEAEYPKLAEQARNRSKNTAALTGDITLPTAAEVAALKPKPTSQPATDGLAPVDPGLMDILNPKPGSGK